MEEPGRTSLAVFRLSHPSELSVSSMGDGGSRNGLAAEGRLLNKPLAAQC